MNDAKELMNKFILSLNNLYSLSFQKAKSFNDIKQAIYILGQLINFYKRELDKLPSKTASLNNLIKLANYLDKEGLYDLANIIDESILIVKKANNYGFLPKNRCNKINNKKEEIIKPLNEISLSTRYCPDHNGVQVVRISENIYQCPIDGKKYNYETGYVNYKGQKVPGGSVAMQTPSTSDFGGIPMRIYDSRSDVLNRIN